MGQNNGNGNPPKVELELNQEARLKILKPVYEGKNSYGKFFLYSVTDTNSGEIKSFFPPDEIHAIIKEQKLGVGSEFLLKRVQNGKGSSKLELSILGKAEVPVKTTEDGLKELLVQSIKIVQEAVSESGIQFSNQEIQDLISTVFIQKTKLA